MKTFIILVIGMILGATLGIILHCMLIVAKESDKNL
jgi:enoyl-CoA hydratase/carnithine racemase